MSKRRGETLVEVVVSCGVMSVVVIGLAGFVVTMVSNIVESRTVTQAAAMAQQGLVDGVAMVNTLCYFDVTDSNTSDASLNTAVLNVLSRTSEGISLEVTLDVLSNTEQTAV